jgi:hypothetical protein
MQLRHYLLNEGHYLLSITEEKFNHLLKTDFSDAMSAKNSLYRGIDRQHKNNYYYCNDPPDVERESKKISNYYTWIINHHSAWKKYPKRNTICTNILGSASSFGAPYIIYPRNGAKIGVCPTDDIWYSFEYFYSHIFILQKYNSILDSIFDTLDIVKPKTLKQFKDSLLSITKMCKNPINIEKLKIKYYASDELKFWIQIIQQEKHLWDYIGKELLNPDKNGFIVVDFVDDITAAARECWIDSPYLLKRV